MSLVDASLPDELIELGAAIGLLDLPAGADPHTATLNTGWFEDPAAHLSSIFTDADQRAALLGLLGRERGRGAGGLDLGDVPDSQQWIPLTESGPGSLFLVVDTGGPAPVIGLGARLTATGPVALSATVHVPVIRVGGSPAWPAGDIRVAASIDLGAGAGPAGMALAGASIEATIPTDGTVPAFGLVLRGMQLPGQPAPTDVPVTSDGPIGQELLQAALAVLQAQAGGAASAAGQLLALLGVGSPTSAVPPLAVADVLDDGLPALIGWLRSLAGTSTGVRSWLGHLASLLGLDPVAAVVGDGSAGSPFAVVVAAGSAEIGITVELGADGASGHPILRPGLRITMPSPGSFRGRATARVTLAELIVGDRITARPLPAGRAVVHLGPDLPLVTGTSPLVTTNVPRVGAVTVSAFEAGFALDGDGRPGLLLEALGVDIAGHRYPSVDLTMADAVLAVATGGLEAVVDALLTQIATSDEARALLALFGLRRPGTLAPAAWPHTLDLPTLFTDPVGALRGYHAAVMAAGRWGTLLGELGRLVRAGAATPVAGVGTEAQPWSVTVVDGTAGSAFVEAWHGTDGVLHVGARVVPGAVPLGSSAVALRPTLTVALLDMALTGTLDARALPGAALTLSLGDNLTVDLDALSLRATAIDASVAWSRQDGFRVRLAATGTELVIDGTSVPLQLPPFDSAAPAALPTDLPWPLLAALLGDALVTRGPAWLRQLASLLGWDLVPDELVTPPGPSPIGAMSGLPLDRLATHPLGAMRDWLVQLLAGAVTAEVPAIAAWVASLANEAGDAEGMGSERDPYAVPLGAGGPAGAPAELLVWFEPEGTSLYGLPGFLVPPDLTEPLDSATGPGPTPARLAELLERAAGVIPDLSDAISGRRLGPALDLLLTRLADGDALVPASRQSAPGATQHVVEGLTHLEAPLALDVAAHLPAGVPAGRQLFVTPSTPGVGDWPVPTGTTIDLTAPGLPPEAFDVTGIPTTGPWQVLLPTRAAAGGFGGVVARLARVVTAVSATDRVVLVAHGSAGLAAVYAAAGAAGRVQHVVTIASPLGGATFEFLDDPATGDAVRALARLADLVDGNGRDDPAAADALAMLDALGLALDGLRPDATDPTPLRPFPAADFTLPGPAPALPAGTGLTTVVVRFGNEPARRAVAALVRRAIEGALARLVSTRAPDAICVGLRAVVGGDTPPDGSVGAAAAIRVDLHRIALRTPAAAPPRLPRVTATVQVRRQAGWLAGGPRPDHDPLAPRDPRLRWAEVSVTAGPAGTTGNLAPHVGVVLHEAAALGVARARWPIDLSTAGTGLAEETRVLLGRLGGALAGVAEGTVVARFVSVLGALGVHGDGGFNLDAAENLLADPSAAVAAVLGDSTARDRLLTALRVLVGAPLAPGDAATLHVAGVDIGLVLDPPADRGVSVRFATGGLALAGGVSVDGAVRVLATGRLAASVRVRSSGAPGPAGGAALSLVVDAAAAQPVVLRLERLAAGGLVPASAELFPAPDGAALTRLLAAILPAELLRLGLDFAHRAAPAVAGPLLEALGLRAPGDPVGHIRHPAGLLADPLGWLRHDSVLADFDVARLAGLVDGLRALTTGAATAPSGTLPLPWGLRIALAPAPGGAEVRVGWPAGSPLVAGAVTLAGSVALTGGAGAGLAVGVAASVRLAAGGVLAGVDVAAGTRTELALRFTPSGGSELVLPILPATAGWGSLAGLVTGGVTALLPAVLDAVAAEGGAVGTAVRTAGDALGLRPGGRFDGAQLEELAGDPAAQVVLRIRANRVPSLEALGSLFSLALPAGTVTVDPATATLRVAPSPKGRVELQVPAAGLPTVCAVLAGVTPVAGMSLDATVCVSPSGVRRLEATLAVTGADLLDVGGVSFFPFAGVAVGPDASVGGDRVEAGLFLAPPSVAGRRALVVQIAFGGAPTMLCRAGAGPDPGGVGACLGELVRTVVVPLLSDLLTTQAAFATRMNASLLGITTLDALLVPHVLQRDPAGAYHLEPAVLDPDRVLDQLLALAGAVATQLTAALSPRALDPFRVRLVATTTGPVTRFGIRIAAPAGPGLVLFDTDSVTLAVETDTSWYPAGSTPAPPTEGGVELLLVAREGSAFRLDPEIHVQGLGVRASSPSTGKLVDLGVSVRSIAAHVALDRSSAAGSGASRVGGHVELDGLAVPLGRASGDNPVAGKILASSSSTSPQGDRTELAPAFSPAVVLWKDGAAPLSVILRAGAGNGPWWLPIQRSFGPVYVEQIGVGAENTGNRTTAVQLLLDGRLAMLGLTVGVDDLSVTVPFATPLDPATWRLGLAGLAVGYESGGISVAGGLRERRVPGRAPDYLGMVRIRFAQFGITAIGGFGEYPDGSGGTYTSFFLFGALSAPLGGPPAFFVTGIGAGAGINRRLVVPPEMAQLPSFPLVAAMDPGSALARDPMAALDTLGTTFPPERGTFWFAVGVRFTSFVVVESVAVLAIEVSDGLEVNLMGLSRMDLPQPLTPMAHIELALRARFSTREGVLDVRAQLTDNSWVIHPSCRLAGGFAWVTWFRTGQFVLTLGGYHPRFAKPAGFPDVPRLSFSWPVSSVISIKGEAYFALTSSCVMAGGRLEISVQAGWLWGRLVAGVDILIAWDPFYYNLHAYVQVTVGFKIEICVPFLGCARVSFSLSIGADLEIEGPELRGRARLDLDVTSFTVTFGATGSTNSNNRLQWPAFRNKYLVAGDEQGRALDAVVTAGQLAVPSGGQPDAGTAARPWRLLPEFELATSTRAASTTVNGVALTGEAGLPLAAGPMKVAAISSGHRVALRRRAGGEVVTNRPGVAVSPVTGHVPAAIWTSFTGTEPPAEAKVRQAGVGARVVVTARPEGGPVPLPVDEFDPPGPRHPLPFHAEQAARSSVQPIAAEADAFRLAQPTGTAAIFQAAASYLDTGVFQRTQLSTLERRQFTSQRAAPPRLAPLTEGIVDPVKPPAAVTAKAAPPPPDQPDTTVHPPKLEGLLRTVPPGRPAAVLRTTVTKSQRIDVAPLARRAAPALDDVRAEVATTPLAAVLVLRSAPADVAGGTVRAAGAAPVTAWAGGAAERRNGLLVPEAMAEAMSEATDRITNGVAVLPGDIQRWRLPNSANDLARHRRPVLVAKGDQVTRVVALDRAGAVLADQSEYGYQLEVPTGTDRLVVLGAGSAGLAGAGMAGWHAGSLVAQVGPDTYLAHRSVITADASSTLRGRRRVDTALVPAAEAVAGFGTVVTRLPAGTRAVAVALEAEGALDSSLDGLVLGLAGAARAVDGEGRPLRPAVSVSGTRAIAVFDVVPDPKAVAVRVTVASDERWLLAGVVGATGEGAAASLAGRLAMGGMAGVAGTLVGDPLGSSLVRWSPPKTVPHTPRPPLPRPQK